MSLFDKTEDFHFNFPMENKYKICGVISSNQPPLKKRLSNVNRAIVYPIENNHNKEMSNVNKKQLQDSCSTSLTQKRIKLFEANCKSVEVINDNKNLIKCFRSKLCNHVTSQCTELGKLKYHKGIDPNWPKGFYCCHNYYFASNESLDIILRKGKFYIIIR